MSKYTYYVYILASQKYGTLYIGVTKNLSKRLFEHKYHLVKGFTQKYDVESLVYFEEYEDINLAITREKQMKKWKRDWKIRLIESKNPEWEDLSIILNLIPDDGPLPSQG
jgi:putative endonuclease